MAACESDVTEWLVLVCQQEILVPAAKTRLSGGRPAPQEDNNSLGSKQLLLVLLLMTEIVELHMSLPTHAKHQFPFQEFFALCRDKSTVMSDR